MKKILSCFVLLSVLIVLILPMMTSAAVGTPTEVPSSCVLKHDIKIGTETHVKGTTIGEPRADWGIICLMDKVYTAIDWIFWILIAITGILVLIGAFYYAFAAGDPKQATKGKQIIMAAIVSLVVAMFSRAIPSILMAILW